MDTVSEAEIRELIARQKCYDVLTRYCRALDRCDVELMKSVYHEDGFDDHGIFQGNAQEFAEYIIREIQEWFEVTTHAICNVHMEIDGDVACTESYLLAYHIVRPDRMDDIFGSTYMQQFNIAPEQRGRHLYIFGGRYVDRLERRGGEWRIARRQVVMDWNENVPSTLILDEGINASLTLRGSRSPQDPVFLNRP